MIGNALFNDLISTIVWGIIGAIAVSTIPIIFITKYKLKVEQIKADAMIKVEEVRAKNQLEIEEMMIQDQKESDYGKQRFNTNSHYDEVLDEKMAKGKNRV